MCHLTEILSKEKLIWVPYRSDKTVSDETKHPFNLPTLNTLSLAQEFEIEYYSALKVSRPVHNYLYIFT